MSPTVARLAGFLPLVILGVFEWERLSTTGSAARGLAWVAVALAAMLAAVATTRLPARARALALAGLVVVALLAAILTAGLPPGLLKPARWDELGAGISRGAEALSSVRLPYAGADPWPQQTLDLGGALLCVVAGLLSAWPRANGRRGFPFFAWAVLLVLAVSPVVSLGGEQPLILGVALALMSIVFLWLERLPLRSGLAAAALCGIALAGALPLSAAADRGQPWFDYRSFTENLGPVHPERFDWDHDYGPIAWPRDGRELFRVRAPHAAYWKAETLDTFDGERWRAGGGPQPQDIKPAADLAPNWRDHPEWTGSVRVTISNLRSLDVIGPGTLLGVSQSTRPTFPGAQAGTFATVSDLRKGDSYSVRFHDPVPTRAQLARAPLQGLGEHGRELTLHVPRDPAYRLRQRLDGLRPRDELPPADVSFPPFGATLAPVAVYPTLGEQGSGAAALRRSPYARTWALAQRLRRGARTPLDYVLAINAYLEQGFRYTEDPPAPAPGRAPLDAFLFDSKAGYCQHFSGAMAILLRMGGIPARVGSGFTPGGFARDEGEWIVRDTDAHSWVEAWFEGFGWVTFDPTPLATPARSQIAAIQSTQSAAQDSGDNGGASGNAADRQAGAKRNRDANEPGASANAGHAGGGGLARWRLALGSLVLAALAAGLLVRRRRLAALGPDAALERALAQLQVALRRSGHTARPARRSPRWSAVCTSTATPPPTCAVCARAATGASGACRRTPSGARCAGSSPAAWGSSGSCARCGRCRRGAEGRCRVALPPWR